MLDRAIAVEFCLSVCLSVKCMHPDKMKESSAYILIRFERRIHLVLRHEEWFVGYTHFHLKFLSKLTPSFKKRQFPVDIHL